MRFIFPSLPAVWAAVVAVGCILLQSADARGEGTIVVNWPQSTNYVTANCDFTPPPRETVVDGTARIYLYNQDLICPTKDPVYSPPDGATGYFRSAGWIDTTGSEPRALFRRIFDNMHGDRISHFTGSQASHKGISVFGAAFLAFLKEDFLNGGASKTVQFGTDARGRPVGSLSAEYLGTDGPAALRFAILNDGQWYVSEVSRIDRGTLAIPSEQILASKWGKWSPTGGLNGRLGPAPTEFPVRGSEFRNIQGIGYFAEFNGAFEQQVFIDITSFTATALVSP